MNANDHHDAGDDENALAKARLQKVEAAIEHTKQTLCDLIEVRDALKSELGIKEET